MSKIKVNSIEAATGSTVTLPSGQTLDLSSGTVTLPNSSVNLTTKVTGTLPVANGGTGLTTLGSATQVLRVNSGATALEFATAPSGKVLQVVSTTKDDIFTASLNNAFTDITGLTATITPASSSNKILITCMINFGISGGYPAAFKLFRGTTQICFGSATPLSNRHATATSPMQQGGGGDVNRGINSIIHFLDSPSTTSSTTYKIQGGVLQSTATLQINSSGSDGDSTFITRSASTITVMEIQA